MNQIILNILKRKIIMGEITVKSIKDADYKSAIEAWQADAEAKVFGEKEN